MKLYNIISEREDPSVLDKSLMKEIRKNIRDGANNLDKDWSNVMELVRVAYQEAGIITPTPSERGGWSQYEELLQYAVEEMSESRKHLSQDWKMSSDVFGY